MALIRPPGIVHRGSLKGTPAIRLKGSPMGAPGTSCVKVISRRPPWRPRPPAIERLLNLYRRNRRQRIISNVFNPFHPTICAM